MVTTTLLINKIKQQSNLQLITKKNIYTCSNLKK